MLQVKNLVKRYVAKGETVTALAGVSVDFPERGMVFLLGKSGSGKSTLLNVSGGLDEPDEGEVIVNGKSSKDFSKSDFDSYRNTYLGFIFQEYNILAELTVAENVALAIELQGKPKDDALVNDLLKQVDLDGYGDRRPNTLSGGQKQRVAIARALVKNPEIIMADEPTGALDSKTGKQVFDTLKKLSEKKLVVVVSHDREFAEVYADRIIELRDGHIVSDVIRTAEQQEIARKNLNEITEQKIAVASGAQTTDEEAEKILAFVKNHKGAVVISAEEEDLAALPEKEYAARFVENPMEPIVPEKTEANFIKSRFPFRYAVKMAFSSLRLKPVRLIFTTLLATVAFIVFGVFSTLLTYDSTKIGARALSSSEYGAAVLTKYGIAHMRNEEEGRSYTNRIMTGVLSAHFSESEIEKIQKDNPSMDFIPAFTFNFPSIGFGGNQSRSADSDSYNMYYEAIEEFTAFAYASQAQTYFDDGTMTLLAGTMPEGNDEILISKPVWETFLQFGYLDPQPCEIHDYSDMIGQDRTIRIAAVGGNYMYLRIAGVYDAHESFPDYEYLKDNPRISDETLLSEQRELAERFAYSMSSLCFVADGFYEAYSSYDLYRNRNARIDTMYFESSNYLDVDWVEGPWGRYARSVRVKDEAEAEGSYCQYLFAPLSKHRSGRCTTVMRIDSKDDASLDIDYSAPYAFMSDLRSNREIFHKILVILGPASAALAVFAALLLFNFISASITAKKKDIGILRAVGARGIDVFKIFVVEGLIIALICFALGSVGAMLVSMLVNKVLLSMEVLGFGMFYFEALNALIVLAISLAASLFATAVPVAITAKKKPVEAIRSI